MRLALAALLVPTLALADVRTEADALVRAIKKRDASAIALQLRTPLKHHGIWFPDAACRKRFGHAAVLLTSERPAFARCLATLQPQLSTRASSAPETAVLTFAPGIELEVEFYNGEVRTLAPAGHHVGPMLTVQTFEALRTRGTTLLDDKLTKVAPGSTWLRTCLDARGAATRAIVWSSSAEMSAAVLAATADWAFKPFTVGRTAHAACSLSLITYPASDAPGVEQLPQVGEYDWEDDLVEPPPFGVPLSASIVTLQQRELQALAARPLDPKPATAAQLSVAAPDRISEVNVCIDTRGAVRNAVAVRHRPGDAPRLSRIKQWTFKPYKERYTGRARDACALFSFITQ